MVVVLRTKKSVFPASPRAAAESALSFPSEKNVISFLPLLDFSFFFSFFPVLPSLPPSLLSSLFLKSEMPASDIAVKLCDRTEGRASEIRTEAERGLRPVPRRSRARHDRLPKVQEIMLRNRKGPDQNVLGHGTARRGVEQNYPQLGNCIIAWVKLQNGKRNVSPITLT